MKLSLRFQRAPLVAVVALATTTTAFAATSCAGDDPAADREDVVDASTALDASTSDAEASCEADACAPSALRCDQADWCPVSSPLDPKNSLVAVWGTGANDVWATGSGGTALHYDGATWRAIPTGSPNTFHAIWGTASNDVWLVSSASSILHMVGLAGTSATFQKVSVAGPTAIGGRLLSMSGTGPSDMRIVGEPLFDTDFGTGITQKGNHLRFGPRDGGAGFELLEGFDGAFGNATVHAVVCRKEGDVWVSVDDGGDRPWMRGAMLHGTKQGDGGAAAWTWTAIDTQSNAPLRALWASPDGAVWAVGDRGVVRRIASGSAIATVVTSETSANLRSVWGSGAGDVWIAGDDSTILHYDGAALRPSSIASTFGTPPRLLGVWGSGPNDAWIVGDGALLHFTGKKPASRSEGP